MDNAQGTNRHERDVLKAILMEICNDMESISADDAYAVEANIKLMIDMHPEWSFEEMVKRARLMVEESRKQDA